MQPEVDDELSFLLSDEVGLCTAEIDRLAAEGERLRVEMERILDIPGEGAEREHRLSILTQQMVENARRLQQTVMAMRSRVAKG